MTSARTVAVVRGVGVVLGLGVGAAVLHRRRQRYEDDASASWKQGSLLATSTSSASSEPVVASPSLSGTAAEVDELPSVQTPNIAASTVSEEVATPPVRSLEAAMEQAAPCEEGVLCWRNRRKSSPASPSSKPEKEEVRPRAATRSGEGLGGKVSSLWAGAEEVREIAASALIEAAVHFDDASSSWSSSSNEDGVHLSSLPRPNSRLPIFRGLLEVAAEEAPCMTDVAQVMLSYSCRRLWDPHFEKSTLLARCGGSTGLVCNFYKDNDVNGRSMAVGAFGVRRQATTAESAELVQPGAGVHERLTVAFAAVPESLTATFADRLANLTGDEATSRKDSKLWALDALVREDGTMRVGFLIHSDLSTLRFPAYLLRKIAASAPAQPVTQIVMLASVGMTPRNTVTLSGPEQEEETEERFIGGRKIRVSKLLQDVFPEDLRRGR